MRRLRDNWVRSLALRQRFGGLTISKQSKVDPEDQGICRAHDIINRGNIDGLQTAQRPHTPNTPKCSPHPSSTLCLSRLSNFSTFPSFKILSTLDLNLSPLSSILSLQSNLVYFVISSFYQYKQSYPHFSFAKQSIYFLLT